MAKKRGEYLTINLETAPVSALLELRRNPRIHLNTVDKLTQAITSRPNLPVEVFRRAHDGCRPEAEVIGQRPIRYVDSHGQFPDSSGVENIYILHCRRHNVTSLEIPRNQLSGQD
ncbi:hypothetical protein A3K55_02695 [Candidatus Shapirobacteria bacterium RBG_13_44_7]|uniref:Uncharacterized protein n=1 Tax=Candidatus Shapirobacteria bacterium RBG_13_44_7 TaxID=1802149 RepID=A0A1F7SGF0_9BACT|nr:MAG: hypothetical protein A3K55_02695 [Candidatus Shapirobacteria bacterium RBG_13_44_7]